MSFKDVEQLVKAIHDAPYKLVLEFAGAGSLALYWLHSVAGSSRTILEASDRYSSESLQGRISARPSKFVSTETALLMTERAYKRAVDLCPEGKMLLGVACTATIATDREKRGEHGCVIAVQDLKRVSTFQIILKKGTRDRQGEEELVSRLLIQAIAYACGLTAKVAINLAEGEIIREDTFERPLSY